STATGYAEYGEPVIFNNLLNNASFESGDFTFNLARLDFRDFLVRYSNNYSELNGYFTNYLPYLLLPEGVLGGEFSYKSEMVDLGELIPTEEALPDTPTDSIAKIPVDSLQTREAVAGVIQVNPNIDFRLNLDIDTLRYFKLDITGLKGDLTITDGGLILNDGRLKMVGGSAEMEGYYRPVQKDKALFSYTVKAQNLDVKRAYEEMELFHELVPAAEKASGIISLDYQISGSLDGKMVPELPSLEGGGTMLVHDVQFKDYKLFGTVSKQTKFNSLKDPNMKEIKVRSTIDNNLLTMERFKFKVRPFRLRMEGETSLDGDLNLQMRVGLPPFGIIGIPIKITGNSEDMQIKMGKRKKELTELEYEDDDLSEEQRLRFNLLRDSISEDMSIEEIQALEQRMDSIDLKTILQKPDSLQQDILLDSLQIQQRIDSVKTRTYRAPAPGPGSIPDSLRN
ncbi:MAG: AsmA-like C-terminal region-containing protein, partial [Robiginitalea sp.]|nr:AsmA-like C-terminal region-containing protein [Robiginitalea sp.]